MQPPVHYSADEMFGYLRIIGLLRDSNLGKHRIYQVEAVCCGDILERSQLSLSETKRKDRGCCSKCTRYKKDELDRYPVGEVIGPITVESIDKDRKYRYVRWSCCGKVTKVSLRRLSSMVYRAKQERPFVCLACTWKAKRKAEMERGGNSLVPFLLPYGIISAGDSKAWPLPGRSV